MTATRKPAASGRLAPLNTIRNPLAFATSVLAKWKLLGTKDEDELMSVAINAMVNGVLAWNPSGGRSLLSWCWGYMERDIDRARRRIYRERAELGVEACVSEEEWLHYDGGTEAYHRAELRIDLQHWADLAELTDYQRFVVEWMALHHGVYVRDTPLAGQLSPFNGSGASTFKRAASHMRQAALTNQRRDDAWTRRRNNLSGATKVGRAMASAQQNLVA